jgi:hypothetical protein
MAFFPCAPRTGASSRRRPRLFAGLQLESLENRVMPYAVSGNAWPHPERITLSFMPDGTNLGGPTSNLFAKFDAAFGSAAAWENVVLKAAQTWAQQTNINFSVVADNGTASGSGAYQQGDPGMGDIRIGGFAFGNSNLLALGYMPPKVNNYSVAGDIAINTAQIFNINGNDYDLYTVMMHELGHALGLDHSTSALAVMYSAYEGADSGLNSDDIAGIQSLYGGARKADSLDAAASNASFATASQITSYINGTSLIAQLPQLDITSTSDVEYFKFTAPASSASMMTVSVQSRGLSLLAPSLRVYNSAETQLGAVLGSGYQGSTLNLTVNVTPGQVYYVRVAGANTSAFGTGEYALTVNLGTSTAPAVQPPNTQVANGNPENGGGGVANRTDSNGVSIAPLLIGVDRLVYNLTGGLLGGVLSDLVNDVVSTVVDLPFVDSLSSVPRIDAVLRQPTIAALVTAPTLPTSPVVVFAPAPPILLTVAPSTAPSPLPPPVTGYSIPEVRDVTPAVAPRRLSATDDADVARHATVAARGLAFGGRSTIAKPQAATVEPQAAHATPQAVDRAPVWDLGSALVGAFALNGLTSPQERRRQPRRGQ